MQPTKFALVLGNSAYAGDLWLRSPKYDAEQTAAALKRLQFDVTLGVDLKYDQINSLIDGFVDRMANEKPFVTVVYYSGHGLQVEDQNFIVPTDFQAGDIIQLVSVQRILDRVASYSNLQIVLLDACRSSMEPREVLQGKSVGVIGGKTLALSGEHHEPRAGLAEMQGLSSTFIAFAAAPGDVAYDGVSLLSPFTEAFLKNVELVDIPLSNLMSRVRQEVYRTTGYRQRTWDHSSLMLPFYFNPGSMFLFMGNALAIFGLLVSMIPYSISLASPESSWRLIAISSAFPLVSLFILMFGSHTVYSRLRGAIQDREDGPPSLRDYLLISLKKGIVGGFIGSVLAAVVISFIYDRLWITKFNEWVQQTLSGGALQRMQPPEPLGLITVYVAIATTVTGCILGFLTLFFARVDLRPTKLRLSNNRSPTRTLFGSAFGGALSGLIGAPIVTYYFTKQPGPEAMPELLLPSGIIGAAILVFSIVNFDFERLTSRRLVTSFLCVLAAVVVGGVAAAAFLSALYIVGLVDIVVEWLSRNSENALVILVGGAIYGILIGLTLGSVIGLAITLTNRWAERDVLQTGDK